MYLSLIALAMVWHAKKDRFEQIVSTATIDCSNEWTDWKTDHVATEKLNGIPAS